MLPSDRELVKDQLLNFLLAGRDTVPILSILDYLLADSRLQTASLLTFCLYILATNPDITQRLKSEIFAAFGNNSIQSTDSLKQLTYRKLGPALRSRALHLLDSRTVRAVIDETLRLFPPVPFNIRRSSE